jgi:hypothetical protein
MKRLAIIAAILVTAILASTAGASALWSHHTAGVWCKSASTASGLAVLCVPESNHGYGVGISGKAIVVLNIDTGRKVFAKQQP